MKKYLLILIGFILLIFDIRFGVMDFPAFESFRTEAPETVKMVVGHVVGDKLQVDVFSDAVGFVLVLIGSLLFLLGGTIKEDSKAYFHFKRLIPWCISGLIFYFVEKLMPFGLNGNLRFRSEYALYFICLATKVTTMGHSMFGVAESMESTESHIRNNLSIIFIMLSLGTFVVSRVAYFYELIIPAWIYYGLSTIFAVVVGIRIYLDIKKAKE